MGSCRANSRQLGISPWQLTDDDFISSKLLGDVARFLVQASGLKKSFLDSYLDLLQDWGSEQENSNLRSLDENLNRAEDYQQQEEMMHFSEAKEQKKFYTSIEGIDNSSDEYI